MTIMQMLLGGAPNEFNVPISGNVANFNLRSTLLAAPYNWDGVSPIIVNVNIAPGAVVSSLSTATAAFATGVFPTGSLVFINNAGSIVGRGGDGGAGQGDSVGGNGANGGTALNIDASLSGRVTITNGSGLIGGGGGAGGGGALTSGNHGAKSATSTMGGSGGAAGAGGGTGGIGPTPTTGDINYAGLPGNDSTTSGPGTGGASQQLPGFDSRFTTGKGGDGGDFGADGQDGSLNGTGGGSPGTKGFAGKAIELNGGVAPTFVSGGTFPNIKGAIS